MKNQEIDELLTHSDGYCVSVLISTTRFAEGKGTDKIVLKKAVNQAKELLKNLPDAPYLLDNKLDKLCEEVNHAHDQDGLGLFVSGSLAKVVRFPFPVKETVSVGLSFEGRELLYYRNLPEYILLSLSRKEIRLYKGKAEQLKEILNEDFPQHYDETYEYEKASLASSNSYSLKAVEKDKRKMKETRFKTFLRAADRSLGKYIQNGIPLILSGVTKDVAEYKQFGRYREHVIGTVIASHSYNKKEVSEAAWQCVKDYVQLQNEMLVNKLRELLGRGNAVYGINNSLEAASDGRGLILMVEKDLETGTYPSPHQRSNSWHSSAAAAYAASHYDEINEIIKIVLDKKGRVIFIENGKLADFGGIALILRYNGIPLLG